MTRPSLARRLATSALLWIVLLLAGGGGLLSYAFRRSAEAAFDVRLEAWLLALVGALHGETGGVLELRPSLGDPRFDKPLSGWYWQVSRGGEPIASSRSLWDASLQEPAPAAADAGSAVRAAGPRGESLRVIVRDITLPGGSLPLRLTLAGDDAELRREIDRFDTLLLASLGALGLGMMALVVTQMRLALRPLHALTRDLGAVRTGHSDRVGPQVPRELGPLVDSVNELLAHDAELVERARANASDLAHALKTPLSLVWAEAEELGGEHGARILRHADAMRRHIERRLASAVPRPAVAGGRTPVAPVVEALADTLGRLHPSCSIDTRLPSELAFRGAREDLEEIVGNLLDNACKWARSRVRVELRRDGPSLLLEVEDDGPGLDAAQYDAVLGRGTRLDEQAPGSGLGLAIVREIVDLHAGRLSLERGDLGGLRALVRLPAAAAGAASDAAEGRRPR